MKNKIIKIINMLVLFCLMASGILLYGIRPVLAAGTGSAYPNELKIGESKTLVVGRAYSWTNIDPSIIELTAVRGHDTATVRGLKEGVTTISVGTAVGQVISFGFTVTDPDSSGGDNSGGNGDGNGSDNGGDNGGGNDGNGNGDGDNLMEIPGLNSKTAADTVLNIGGSEWILLRNIEMEGSYYAMLLKKSAMGHIIFEMSGSDYDGSQLQKAFTDAFTDSHIPKALMHNAVVPKLGDNSVNAVSAPTSKMASSVSSKKDIIFPLSYKEATDWSGSAYNSKLYLESRWWLRTPDGDTKWHYVMPAAGGSPKEGSIISSTTEAMNTMIINLRPAIWVKYG